MAQELYQRYSPRLYHDVNYPLKNKKKDSLNQLIFNFDKFKSINIERSIKRPRVDSELKHLDLEHLVVANDPQSQQTFILLIREIAECLQNDFIESLNISYSQLNDSHIEILSRALKFNMSLKKLNLSSNPISRTGMIALSDALKFNKGLKNLTIENIIKSNEVKVIAPLLVSSKLSFLSISNEEVYQTDQNCGIGIQGANLLEVMLGDNTDLYELNLAYNNIQNKGAQYVANSLLAKLGALQKISLSHNSIGNVGAEHIANSLKKNDRLISLDMSNNNITDQGIDAFIEMLNVNTTLTELNIQGNGGISQEKQVKIKEIMEKRSLSNFGNLSSNVNVSSSFTHASPIKALQNYEAGSRYYAKAQYQEALSYLEAAAQEGYLAAYVKLYKLYQGDLFPPALNVTKQKTCYLKVASNFRWFEKEAEMGGADALANLGRCYELGFGVWEVNGPRALLYYVLAAEQRDISGCCNAGLLYRNAKGVERNLEEAVKYYTIAANLGAARAQYALGEIYNDPQFIRRDPNTALYYYKLAAAQEHKESIEKVKELSGKIGQSQVTSGHTSNSSSFQGVFMPIPVATENSSRNISTVAISAVVMEQEENLEGLNL